MADGDTTGGRDVPARFEIELVLRGDRTLLIIVRGELDVAAADRLDETFDHVRDSGVRRVLLDLRGVSFIDSTGLGSILRGKLTLDGVAAELQVTYLPGAVQRAFEMTRTHQVVRVVPPREIDWGGS